MADEDIDSADEYLEGDVDPADEDVPAIPYDVTSYGSDPEVEGLVNRLRRGDLITPAFQRDYVWKLPEASKFIESLLLGLPVPGVFFATEPDSRKQLVIDGQQRLKTLLFFYDGFFNPRAQDRTQRVFSLTKVQPVFEGKTYQSLPEHDRIRLDTSIIHATIVKQTSPPGDDTSLFHIFERLNSGGRRLTNQEMRVALYHGELVDAIREANTIDAWRRAFGKVHSRLKDQELILRFMAFYDEASSYSRPLSEFLSRYAARNKDMPKYKLEQRKKLFRDVVSIFDESLDDKPFRLTKTFNVAVFDSCTVGLARRIDGNPERPLNPKNVKKAYKQLLDDEEYVEAVSRSTADDEFVKRRIEKAVQVFSGC